MNPQLKQMPLWRDANRLLILIEEAVRHFPRYHKYTLGSDLRKQAMNINRWIARAVHDKAGRAQHVKRLIFSIDDMKILKRLKFFTKLNQNFHIIYTEY